jgi:hypothetical protein
MAKGTDRRSPPRHSVDPVVRVDIGPPPAFLLRKPPTAEEPTTKAPSGWSAMAPMVLVTLGVAALLVVAVTNGYWLTFSEREQVVAEVAALKTAPTGALPAPEMTPARSAPQLTVGLPSPDDQPPPDEAITPLAAASPPMVASDQSPTVISSLPPITEQVPIAVASAEVPQVPASEKPVAALRDDNVFVVRFDSKLPGLTPTRSLWPPGSARAAAWRASELTMGPALPSRLTQDEPGATEGTRRARFLRRSSEPYASGIRRAEEIFPIQIARWQSPSGGTPPN